MKFAMISLLREYLKINTADPEPRYDDVLRLFRQQAVEDRLVVKECLLPSGYPVLVLTVFGSDLSLPALALNHHMDTVPATSCCVRYSDQMCDICNTDNLIVGRGAQDCKGLGVVYYGALRALVHEGFQPKRTIHLLMVPDEEQGGFLGTKQFIKHELFSDLCIGYLVDEGMPSGDDNLILIKIDERVPIQVRVTASGRPGHSSGLFHQNATHELLLFLRNIVAYHDTEKLKANTRTAGNFCSLHITSLSTSSAVLNMIPQSAQATLDFRLAPTVSIDQGRKMLEEFLKPYPKLSYEVLAISEERIRPASQDGVLYDALKEAIELHGYKVEPYVFEATTDARYYSQCGIEVLGCTPFRCESNLHGDHESIRIDDLKVGIEVMCDFLKLFCGNKKKR